MQLSSRLHDHSCEPGLTGLTASGMVTNDGLDIAWFEAGPADAELTVVFIHGYCLSSESYFDQVNHLRDHKGVRSLLIDVRGHGLSTATEPARCNVNDAARDVLAVLEQRCPGGNMVIVGHSLGGMIALALMRLAPPAVAARVRSLLLIATSMRRFADHGAARFLRTALASALYYALVRLPDEVNSFRWKVASVITPVIATFVSAIPQMARIQFHVAMMLDTPLSSYIGYFDDLVEHSELSAGKHLRGIPGEIVVGSMDIVTPKVQSEVIHDHWPDATLSVVEGAGHMVILEEPEKVSAALDRVIALARKNEQG